MSYLGSKGGAGVYQTIISQFPPHDTYIETHLGSGVVMRNKPRAACHIGIDMDLDIIIKADDDNDGEWMADTLVGGDCVNFLQRSHEWLPGTRTLIYADPPYLLETRTSEHRYKHEYSVDDHVCMLEYFKSITDPGDLEAIARSHVDGSDCGRSRFPPKIKITSGGYDPEATTISGSQSDLPVQVTNQNYSSQSRQPDLPAPPTTTTAAVVISGYPSSLYDEILSDWRSIQFQAMTRGGVRTEQLWMNYPASRVAWHSYAGSNKTDRQRIKRKAQSWADRFEKLPEGERLAIMHAISNTY